MLIEFCGLPGTGKSTLARALARQSQAVLLRIDEIEAGMRRSGLPAEQTGIAAYSVAHDLAASHLARGMLVIVDAVSPVEDARAAWRGVAAEQGVAHLIVETVCPDLDEHRRRVENRANDLRGHRLPVWEQVRERAAEYQPRTDDRLVLDTTQDVDRCARQVADYVLTPTR
jgi:predicted kinase